MFNERSTSFTRMFESDAGVDWDAIDDKSNEADNLDNFIVCNDVKF